jgi:DNA-binding CsgD family transcriptional regulator
MPCLAHHIETCLKTVGSDEFAVAFLDFIETLDIDQIMVFSIEADHARCFMSRHFSRSALAGRLAGKYLDGWFRHDPLLPELHDIPVGEVRLRRMQDFADKMSQDYREIFFETPGLAGKTTLLAAGHSVRLFVNLYQSRPDAPECDPDIARLAGRLVLMHFDQPAQFAEPPPLTALSARERAVCLGILSGKKAEIIADEIGIAPSTVVTYRKRAYQKLGVNSRAGLFAICRA